MNNVFLKLFVDALERYQKLSDAEFGRLIRAALTYKRSGEEIELSGRESLMWDGLKLDIDRDNERQYGVSDIRAEAGRKGAAARWQNYGKNSKSHLPYGKNGYEKDKEKDKEKEYDARTRESIASANPFLNIVAAMEVQGE